MTNGVLSPELLAPVGREEVFYAVLEAGADAVYMAGKQFNMRRHRKDFNFTAEKIHDLVEFAHQHQRKVYITVNSLVGNSELENLRAYLKDLNQTAVDAVIVQDFAVAQLARELDLKLPLHSSTMMNVNSADQALLLKDLGFSRVVTSRDVTLDEVRRIGEGSGLEIEYFIHGDMCSVQSGQCHQSGQMFGKSSNRGQCMKPCRWSYQLKAEESDTIIADNAYLLAAKDLCVLQQLPEFINAGVHSLKIEGRMKPAPLLREIVGTYRAAIDRYQQNPLATHRDFDEVSRIHKNRVRDLSSGFSFKTPDVEYMDHGGQREPIFLSYSGRTTKVDDWEDKPFEKGPKSTVIAPKTPKISFLSANAEQALAAIEAGAERVTLSWEGGVSIDSAWDKKELEQIKAVADQAGCELLLSTPRITTERELGELRRILAILPDFGKIQLTNPGPLRAVNEAGREAHLDSSCNIINRKAAELFIALGAKSIMPAAEASFQDTAELITFCQDKVPVEIQVQGAVTAMIIEHCLVGMCTQKISKKDFCRMPCQHEHYSLIDVKGNSRPLRTDKYCRNHLFLEHDLSVLPALEEFLALGADFWRIDGRFYTAEETTAMIQLYQQAVQKPDAFDYVAQLKTIQPDKTFTYSAYARGIINDQERSLLKMKQSENAEADS